MRGWVLIAAVLLGACSQPMDHEAPPAAVADGVESISESPPDPPPESPYAEFDAILARDPSHMGAAYYVARVAAGRGDTARALADLRRLANSPFDDALEPADFRSLAAHPEFIALSRQLAERAPPIGMADVVETDCADILPEGTAYDVRRGELLISSGRRRSVMTWSAELGCRELLVAPDDRLFAVLGMQVDAARDVLWVATAAAPFMRSDASPAVAAASDPAPRAGASLARIDLATRRVDAVWLLPAPGMLNDLSIAEDGRIFVTESLGGDIWWLDPQKPSGSLKPLFGGAEFEGPNGILALAGGRLLVAHFHGLSLVEPAMADSTAKPQRIDLLAPEGRYLGGFDGLARDGEAVVGVQNLIGRGRVWRFTLDPDARRVESLELKLRAHPDLLNPTTGAVVGDAFWMIADPNLQSFDQGVVSALPAGRRGHRLLQIPLRATTPSR